MQAGTLQFGDDLARNLDGADAVYNGICGLIDTHAAANGIAATPGSRYAPVRQPPADAPGSLDLSASGVSTVIWVTPRHQGQPQLSVASCTPRNYEEAPLADLRNVR